MKIIVDAMGGDNAPMEIVKGAIQAVEEVGTEIILVGNAEAILRCVQELGLQNLPKGLEIANASDVVTMEDDPARAVRDKKDSSMAVMLYKLRDGAPAPSSPARRWWSSGSGASGGRPWRPSCPPGRGAASSSTAGLTPSVPPNTFSSSPIWARSWRRAIWAGRTPASAC